MVEAEDEALCDMFLLKKLCGMPGVNPGFSI